MCVRERDRLDRDGEETHTKRGRGRIWVLLSLSPSLFLLGQWSWVFLLGLPSWSAGPITGSLRLSPHQPTCRLGAPGSLLSP